MNHPDMSFSESRAIVRRHAHDLRNMLNCMDLEIVCFLEDTQSPAVETFLRKLRAQIGLTERTIHSLSVRFREPSVHMAAAADIFFSWRQQLKKLGQADRFQWEDPGCSAAIKVDYTAILTVLSEICLRVKNFPDAPPPAAALQSDGSLVTFTLREPAGENGCPPDVEQWGEWERLVANSGGRLERNAGAPSAPCVTSLIFPVA